MCTLRSVLILSALVLSACGNDECSVPRSGVDEPCDSYDGGQLRFVVGEPPPDVSAYCASACVDVFAPLAIAGYDDLRKVSFLAKVRRVDDLGINVDTLRDLKGIEHVDIVHALSLSSFNGDSSTRTLEGLVDGEFDSFEVRGVSGLASLAGSALTNVGSLAISESSVERLDLSQVTVEFFTLRDNDSLVSVALPTGSLSQLWLTRNPKLSELSWGPNLAVRSNLRVDSNASLSSCRVQELVDQTKVGPRMDFIQDNGPCP